MQSSRRKRVFIGSSSETKEMAERIREKMSPICDCVVWGEDFFKPGGYVYIDLIKKAIGFDFAIMIGGADDKVIRLSQNTEKISPRDNVYLEYGMYSGILSTNKILFLIHKDCRIASDLTGMTLKTYSSEDETLNICQKWLTDALSGTFSNNETAKNIELLPTVGVAVGYFYNFLKPALDVLSSTRKFTFEGKEYTIKEKKLIIDIPDYLESEIDAIEEYKKEVTAQYDLADTFLGRYRILVEPDKLESGSLILHDMPSTLLSVLKTVDFIFGISTGVGPEDAQFAKYRAFDNFIETLVDMMKGKARLFGYVEFRRFQAC